MTPLLTSSTFGYGDENAGFRFARPRGILQPKSGAGRPDTRRREFASRTGSRDIVHDRWLSALVITKGRPSRDFGRLSIFDFFNSIGQERKPNRRRPASYLQAQVERDSLQAFGQRRATLTLNALRVLHGPYGLVSRRIFVAIPRRSTDVQVGVGSSGKHNPRSGVTHGSREPTLR
jgi:hypothetical protein